MNIRETLMEKARQIAHQKAEEFDLAKQFGFEGDEKIMVNGRRLNFSTQATVRTDLEDLTEDIRNFLEDNLPGIIFTQLLDEHLNHEEP